MSYLGKKRSKHDDRNVPSSFGLNNQSPAVTVKVQVYGNNYKSYEATFKLPVS